MVVQIRYVPLRSDTLPIACHGSVARDAVCSSLLSRVTSGRNRRPSLAFDLILHRNWPSGNTTPEIHLLSEQYHYASHSNGPCF
ncbi:hypothetical protein PoB_001465800 [Plakobranchus ocellatus]|uniref:Uncharacterized protein n=1 Tax=Plakobranchus ocellatus TaxID=259542 RepID=A0AAV3Z0J8_9GAST|nr:hypothetical protein PoB_001465800 [Plakobranchus ocellatus]